MATKLGAITGVFGLLPRRIEADFQCVRGDDHARDMALDQVAVRKSGSEALLRPLIQDACARHHT